MVLDLQPVIYANQPSLVESVELIRQIKTSCAEFVKNIGCVQAIRSLRAKDAIDTRKTPGQDLAIMVKPTYTSAGTERCFRVVVHGIRSCSLGAAMSYACKGSWLERAPQKTTNSRRKLRLSQRGRSRKPKPHNEDAGFSSMNESNDCSVADNVVSVIVDKLFVSCRNENQADGFNRIRVFARG